MYLTCLTLAIILYTINADVTFLEAKSDENILRTDSNYEPSVNDIAESLLFIFGGADNGSESNRIKELRDKLQKIDSYVVDKRSYLELIINNTKQTDLNATNFFLALNNTDNSLLLGNDPDKNLYLKIKEKMNRADVLKILSEKSRGKLKKSARRSMSDSMPADKPKTLGEKELNGVIDKMLAETPNDEHTYGEEDKYSKVWDPQVELEERQAKASGRRIFKGERTTIRYYPFMVSIHVMGRFWCGGAIYSSDIVITSASCLQLMHNNRFFRENPKVLAVRVGSNHSRISGELIDALEVYFHPSYNPRTLRNNLALIRLRRHISFSHHRVPKVIPIATSPQTPSFTSEVIVLGWGVTKSSQKMAFEPIFLQRKFLPVYPSNMCKEVYGEKFIRESMFCAGTLTTGEGACDHDAGGPAVMDGKLVGIISFGPTVCGYPNTPTVFTHIGYYSDWIETINENMPSYYRAKQRTTTTTEYPWAEFIKITTKEHNTPRVTHKTTPPPPPPSPSYRGQEQSDNSDEDTLGIDTKKFLESDKDENQKTKSDKHKHQKTSPSQEKDQKTKSDQDEDQNAKSDKEEDQKTKSDQEEEQNTKSEKEDQKTKSSQESDGEASAKPILRTPPDEDSDKSIEFKK